MSDIIALACDHGGLALKETVKETLAKMGFSLLDLGTDSEESVDYPDYADKLADAIKDGKAAKGVLICGTGIGISMAANRHRHIRAALVWSAETARLTREHNDANVLVMGGRTHEPTLAKELVEVFFSTDFEGDRHIRRLAKFSDL